MMSSKARRALNHVGSALALLGVAFVVWRLGQAGAIATLRQLPPSAWVVIVALGVLYGVASLLLARAWWYLLLQTNVSASATWSVTTYGISQLAKYVPGNIFQFAGRQSLGMAAGLPGAALIKSAFWELLILVIAGVMFTPLVLPLVIPGFSSTMSTLLAVASVFTVAGVLRGLIGRHVQKAFLLDLLFLAISGLVFLTLLHLLAKNTNILSHQWPMLIGAYVVAWLLGLLTPGAPAGIGVREALLILLTPSIIKETELLPVVAINRMITMTGDFCCFGLAHWLRQTQD